MDLVLAQFGLEKIFKIECSKNRTRAAKDDDFLTMTITELTQVWRKDAEQVTIEKAMEESVTVIESDDDMGGGSAEEMRSHEPAAKKISVVG